MSNVATLYQLKCNRSYERDGYNEWVNRVQESAGRFEVFSDGLLRGIALGGAKQDLLTAASTLYGVSVSSPAGAAGTLWCRFYNSLAAGITSGTTFPDFVVVLPAGTTKTVPLMQGQPFGTAMCMEAVTTVNGSTAASGGNIPTITYLYK